MGDGCTACGWTSRAGARFCARCGSPLARTCPACGAGIEPEDSFCVACGRAIAPGPAPTPVPSAAPPEGERKQVTVLFADVVDSMQLAEQLDPDALTEVMSGLFDRCRAAVEEFGGTVDKFTGDGIMALFGAPTAQEDHARRACHAAVRIVGRAADLQLRVGLNSGEVVAGSVGEAFTAIGRTVGLAQRMESLAEPGTIYLTEDTASLLEGAFKLTDLGPVRVKGSTEPVRAFRLGAAAGGSAASGRLRSGGARMVGRDAELAMLTTALAEAQEGRAQVVGIVGEAGSGKSRLCAELSRHALASGVKVYQTAGVSHAQTVPLLPILGLMRALFAVEEDDSPAAVRAKVTDRVNALGAALDDDLALIYDFMEVPDPDRPAVRLGPAARQRRILDVFRRMTARRSQQEQCLLLVLEDLHWFDGASVEFLAAWLPAFPHTRTLFALNFRPEFRPPWTYSYYRQIALSPLAGSAVLSLLEQLLGPDPSMAELARELSWRAGGNPFFVEEMVRGLAAEGTLAGARGAYRLTRPATEVRVPATVHAVLADRIDRLGARDKAVLQGAAVIGRTFDSAILGPVSGLFDDDLSDSLQALCTQELLQEHGPDGEFRFWHPLTQEVAYTSLLAAPRARLHRAVAQGLIALGPDRHDELAALIATHFEAAGNHVETARWQLRAATRALRGQYSEVQHRLRSCMEHASLAEESDDALTLGIRARIVLLRFGASSGMNVADADRISAEAHAAAERLGDPGLLAGVLIADSVARYYRGELTPALTSMQKAREQADRLGARDRRAFVWALTALQSMYTGPLPQGLDAVETVLDLCADDPLIGMSEAGYSCYDFAHMVGAYLGAFAGRLEQARRSAQLSVAGYEERPLPAWHAWALSAFAHLAMHTGEVADAAHAHEAATTAVRLAEDSGNMAAAVVIALQARGIAELLLGQPLRAVDDMSTALARARADRAGLMYEASLLAYLARAHLANGDAGAARALSEEAVDVARRQGADVMHCQAQLTRAHVLRRTADSKADLDAALTCVTDGLALAKKIGADGSAAFLTEEQALLSGESLDAAASGFEAIGATGHVRRLRLKGPS